MTDDFKQVDKHEFLVFLRSYRGALEHNCITFFDPPTHNYLDWSRATSQIGTMEAYREACQAYFRGDDILDKDGKYWVRQ